MPFPIVRGIPKDTGVEVLSFLRKAIVADLAGTMEVERNSIHPYLHIDQLEKATSAVEGSSTIYVRIDTGHFFRKTGIDEQAKMVTSSLAQVIWNVFKGKFEVEVFIGNLNHDWVTLLKDAKTNKLQNFTFEGVEQEVQFTETDDNISPGVVCDIYAFVGDDSKDLGIIRIDPGCKTPLERVLRGTRTVQGSVSGDGELTITRQGGEIETYSVSDDDPSDCYVDVEVGDVMQWEASPESNLVAYEICFPPYEVGRYEYI